MTRTPNKFGSAIIGSLGTAAVMLLLGFHGCTIDDKPKPPGPGPKPPVPAKQGTHVVVFVDPSAPSVPAALVTDDDQMRALKVKGRCRIVPISDKEYLQAKNYNALIDKAGGAAAMAVLGNDGDAVFAGRLPTDKKARDEVLQKYVADLPAPLPPSPKMYKWQTGGANNSVQTVGGRPVVDYDGHVRYLAAYSSPKKLAAALDRYGDHNPVFPVSEWYPLSRANIFGDPDWILDQDGISSCVGNGWAGALRRLRVIAGMKDVKLSPGYTYSLINHNQDQGAVISDGIQALMQSGTCPFSVVGQKPFYRREMPQDASTQAQHYKLVDAYRCETWEETVSALLTGQYVIVFGIQVGQTWTKFDSYGVGGHDRGPGNHCIMAEGVVKLPDGRWALDAVNSWGLNFGPFKNGHVYQDKNHLFGNGDMPDVCALRIAGRCPDEPYDPPAYRAKAGENVAGSLPVN